jgi:hypothetical protein
MRVRRRTAMLTAIGLGVGGVAGFMGELIRDRSHRGASAAWAGLRWTEDVESPPVTAEPKGVVHGTQAGTAHSRLAL